MLIAAVTLAGKVYLFNEDWLQIILLGNYVGIWYFPDLFLALAFQSDVFFLKAILSRLMINLVSSLFAGLSCCVARLFLRNSVAESIWSVHKNMFIG